MAIRARIGIGRPDGAIESVYIHDLPDVRMLLEHWNTEERARVLVELGGMFTLGPTAEECSRINPDETFTMVHSPDEHWPMWGEAWHYLWTDVGWMIREAFIGHDGYNNGRVSDWGSLASEIEADAHPEVVS